MQLARLFRSRGAINFAKAKPPPRVYTVDELKSNNWHFPDEDFSVGSDLTPERLEDTQIVRVCAHP